jgi:hypothetical protein
MAIELVTQAVIMTPGAAHPHIGFVLLLNPVAHPCVYVLFKRCHHHDTSSVATARCTKASSHTSSHPILNQPRACFSHGMLPVAAIIAVTAAIVARAVTGATESTSYKSHAPEAGLWTACSSLCSSVRQLEKTRAGLTGPRATASTQILRNPRLRQSWCASCRCHRRHPRCHCPTTRHACAAHNHAASPATHPRFIIQRRC